MDSELEPKASENKTEKYTYEQILEMLGGNKYFSDNQIKYTYHKLNNRLDDADYYLELCHQEVKALTELYTKMKSPEEISKEI
jgi:hypothetical protein